MNQEPAISLVDVSRTYHDRRVVRALQGITLDIRSGEFFMFVGLSGSGKSTLLRLMSGLDKPTTGTIHLGAGVTQKDMGFVFQQFGLLPWLTVYQNVELGLIGRGVPSAQRARRVMAELGVFGLTNLAHANPRQLSGGQRQRVGIARALVTEPKVIFMDEPFSELDSVTAGQLRGELLDLWTRRRFTVVMVTHILPDAVQLADRIAILQANPGRLARVVDNPLPRPRETRSSAAFGLEDRLAEYLKS